MNINQAKDKVQKEVLRAWWKSNCIGTAELATGVGKSRIGILASSHFAKTNNLNFKILIVVPTTTIKDSWKSEFIKWGESELFKKCVEVECINTAREYKNKKYDLLIADEIHGFLGGESNLKLFNNNEFTKILGLSATIDDNLLQILNNIAPVCYTLTLNNAVELGLVANFKIYNIGVELTKKEQIEYDNLTNIINYSWERFNKHSWKNISLRKTILYNSVNKLKLLVEIVDLLQDKNGIIFSMTKHNTEKVSFLLGNSCVSHHSGISIKKRDINIKKYSDKRTKINKISSALTLQEGANIPYLNYAILMSGTSKVRGQVQKIGRVIRLDSLDKQAIIIRLYCKNTQESKWLESSQKNLDVIEVSNKNELFNFIKNEKM